MPNDLHIERSISESDELFRQTQAIITRLLQDSLEPFSLQELLEDALLLAISIPWISLEPMGSIYLYEEESDSLVLAAQEGMLDIHQENYDRISLKGSDCYQAVLARDTVDSSKHGVKQEFAFAETGAGGHCCIPLFSGDTLLGMLNLFVPDDYQLNRDDTSFLRAFASTLGEIIKRRINEEKLVRAQDSDEILKMLLESAIEPVPLQDQLDLVLTMLFSLPWLPVKAKGAIFLPGGSSAELEIRSYTDNLKDYLESCSNLPNGQCICGRTILSEITIHGPQDETDSDIAELLELHYYIPIMEEGKLSGIMILYLDGVPNLNKENQLFLQSVASVLSIIIVRKRLDARLVQALEEQKLTNRKLDRANIFVRKTFGSYMSEEVVDTILDTPEGMRLGGDEKMVTVLMTDLRGFTAMSEQMVPGEVLNMLNLYLGEMTKILQEYKGTVIEFLGDGILAIFGAPITRDDDAERAVACALSMQQAMPRVNARNKIEGYPELAMGAGINTGMVIAGNIGSDVRRKYGVVGKTINLAARIESITTGGQVLISEMTAEACQSQLQIEEQWKESLKGVANPITISNVTGISGAYDVQLPKLEKVELRSITRTLSVRLSMVVGKQIDKESFHGEIIGLGLPIIEIVSLLDVVKHSNLSISILDANDELISDQIYGKVIVVDDQRRCFRVHLTSLPPGVEEVLSSIEA
jgi:class 3 adenylate cyclase/GAF domain-containing protein